MGISVADNFSYLGGKPLDGRIQYATLAAMKAMADATLYEGCEAYCVATDKYYKWKSSNTVDASTGKWREVSSGGGSGLPSGGTQGQYLVKQSATEGDADWQTLSAFSGSTSQSAGSAGLVPAPSAGDEGKVLFGNGAWGNIVMPSVDLSNSSVESDILDTTEKAVGTTTDGYLIYQKVVSTGGNVPSGATLLMRVQLQNSTDIIRYTKTTDSPLPSDVKFAGVMSSGEVIYKKEIDFGNLPNNDTKKVAHNISFDKAWIERAYAIATNKTSLPLPLVNAVNANYSVQIYLDSTDVIAITKEDQSSFYGYITIYYTTSS